MLRGPVQTSGAGGLVRLVTRQVTGQQTVQTRSVARSGATAAMAMTTLFSTAHSPAGTKKLRKDDEKE